MAVYPSTGTVTVRHTAVWPSLLVLLILTAVVILGAAWRDLYSAEAHSLYLVRDSLPLNVAPRDALRALRTNVTDMLDRAGERSPLVLPYAVVLDAWSLLTGEHIFTARLFSALCYLLLASLWMRVILRGGAFGLVVALIVGGLAFFAREASGWMLLLLVIGMLLRWIAGWRKDFEPHRRRGRGGDLLSPPLRPSPTLWRGDAGGVKPTPRIAIPLTVFAAMIAVLLRPSAPDWQNAIAAVNVERDSTVPALINYPPSHPLAYYDLQLQTRLRHGITLDLGWNAFTEDQLRQVMTAIQGSETVWTMLDTENAQTPRLLELIGESHTPARELRVGNIVLMRWDGL
ncbi:MAG: hypothetical protein SF029_05760 [bacterium]|nr:hypothetical protein [bacterium]